MAAFTVPAIILVCLMMYVPFILSGYYSLTEWNGISKAVKFVGFTNFKTLFSQGGDFLPALWFTTKYTFCFVVFSNGAGAGAGSDADKRSLRGQIFSGEFSSFLIS